jgi:hypothetical protein
MTVCPAVFDCDVLAFDETSFREALMKGSGELCISGR